MNAIVTDQRLAVPARVAQWVITVGILGAFTYAMPIWAITVGCLIFVGMTEVRQ